jgi:(p)ppGpp synthase/HD superfamily hydrolase
MRSATASLETPRPDTPPSVPSVGYAQTNLQLFRQMRQEGYGDADLEAVRRAYDLAARLFTCMYRGSGKPLLAHLVGTASVLVSLRARVPLVAAGVLHAAYFFGDFGDARGGATPAKRQRLAEAAGAEVEEIIRRYDALRWDSQTIAEIHAGAGSLSGLDREVLLLRLANELEDHLDLGVLYCGNADTRRKAVREWLHLCVELAQRLEQPALASAFERVFGEILSEDVPEVLRQREDFTHSLRPESSTLKPAVSARFFLGRLPVVGRLVGRG